MTTAMLEALIPIVAIIMTFGFPVAIVFTFKWFKFKERELQADLEFRKSAGHAIEARVQRLESIIFALDADLRSKLGAPRAELMEGPATTESGQAGHGFVPAVKDR
jgi:hypothetical protein